LSGRWAIRALALIAVLSLSVALVAGCKSSDKKNDNKTPTSGETPEASQTPSDGGGGGGGDGGDEGVQDLERLASQASEEFTGSVSYRTTTEAGGQTTEQEWDITQRPPSDYRFEIVDSEGGQETRTIVIQTAEKSYICSSASGSETCLSSEQTDQYTGLFAPLSDVPASIAQGADSLGLVDKSERDIAGISATCFTYSLAGAESEICFSGEGLLLYLRSESAGSSYTFEATSASTDVSDSDFEPPYPVTELPTG